MQSASENAKGCLHIYRGHGKGKTTAAIGLAARALGAGLRVGIAVFLKDGTSSELGILRAHPHCRVFPCPPSVPFTFAMTAQEKIRFSEQCSALLQEALASADEVDLLILDEVLDAFETELADETPLLEFLKSPSRPEIVLTGRTASAALIACADYITTMQADRHPYTEQKLAARRGIEY